MDQINILFYSVSWVSTIFRFNFVLYFITLKEFYSNITFTILHVINRTEKANILYNHKVNSNVSCRFKLKGFLDGNYQV